VAKNGISESQGAKILGISEEDRHDVVHGNFSDIAEEDIKRYAGQMTLHVKNLPEIVYNAPKKYHRL
jgi:hypothetical protein